MKSLFGAVAVLVFLTLIAPVVAKTIPPPPPESKSTITKVNAQTREVTIIYKNGTYTTAKIPKTYTIDEITTITINNVPGTFADIRAGMVVNGTTERDNHTLDNITLEGSGVVPAAAAPKPAAKPKAPAKPKPATSG